MLLNNNGLDDIFDRFAHLTMICAMIVRSMVPLAVLMRSVVPMAVHMRSLVPMAVLMRSVVPMTVLMRSMVPIRWSMRAICMAFVRPAAATMTCHHLMELCTFCLFLIPIRIRAGLVADLILATCCVA